MLLTAACGCSMPSTGGVTPGIAAHPAVLDFGRVPPGSAWSGIIAITNTGRATLLVSGLTLSGQTPDAFSTGLAPAPIPPGASAQLAVGVTAPADIGTFNASLLIASNASNAHTLAVPLSVEVAPLALNDAGPQDAGEPDAGPQDAGEPDAGPQDAGEPDAGPQDAGEPDAGPQDAGEPDAGPQDAGEPDAGPQDAGEPDAGPQDAGEPDAGSGCPPDDVACDGRCVHISSDIDNCGACDQACTAVPPSTAACVNGLCLLTLANSAPYAPGAIAADSTTVYWIGDNGDWSDPNALVVEKVPIGGGTAATVVTSNGIAGGVSVDSSAIYYEVEVSGSGTSILSVPIAGGTPTTLAGGQSSALCIAVANDTVYWATEDLYGEVYSLPVAGGFPTMLAENQPSPIAVLAEGSAIYWVNTNGSGAVMRYDLAGSEATTIIAQSWPSGVAVDSENIYWTTMPNGAYGGTNGQVFSLPLSGGSPATLASNLVTPRPIVQYGQSLYWAEWGAGQGRGAIATVPVGGGTVITLAPGQGFPNAMTLSGNNLLWVNLGSGEVQQLILR